MEESVLRNLRVFSEIPYSVRILSEKNRAFLAGGAFVSSIKRKPIADFDFFFRTEEEQNVFEKGIESLYPKNSWTADTDFARTIRNSNLQVFQVIKYRFAEPKDILNDFDLNVCKIGYDFGDDRFVIGEGFKDGISSGVLKVTRTKQLFSVIMRVVKYIARYDFKIKKEDILKFSILLAAYQDLEGVKDFVLYGNSRDSALKTSYYAEYAFDTNMLTNPSDGIVFFKELVSLLGKVAI